ncbi:MAG: hypothetical protein PHN39_01535 [Candidatus Pacebacteria bacterium]|nr:hypothetical protein [Candidatus Paceibacterota bacterium]
MKRFLIIVLLLVIIVAAAAGFWFWQNGSWSKEKLKLEIVGPGSAKAGDELTYLVRYKNNGTVRLESMEFIFDFPQNSVPSDGESSRVIRQLDDLYPGEERTIELKARIFGKEKENLEAHARISFQPKNLKSKYDTETSLSTQIESVPITFEFDLPSKIEQGENFNFTLNYFSNVDFPLENLRVQVEYPDNFQFISAQPQALDKKEWKIPTLSQAEGGRISITGKLNEKPGVQKTFRAKLGVIKDGELIILKETAQALEIASANIFISQLINGSPNYAANAGDYLHYEIFFKNIGKKSIEKEAIVVKLEGDLFDLTTFKSSNGSKGEGDDVAIWHWKDVPDLRLLNPGEEGKIEFWIKVKDSAGQRNTNPVLVTRVTLSGVEKLFEAKVNSDIEIMQKVYYKEDVFGNTGPVPLEPSTSTTFTVVWQIKNSWNDLTNAKVKSRLPNYVSLTGKIFPETSNRLTFDSNSREIMWNVGDVNAFQGQDSTSTLAFQIEVTPQDSQDLSSLLLIEDASFFGQDKTTNDIIETKAKAKTVNQLDDIF